MTEWALDRAHWTAGGGAAVEHAFGELVAAPAGLHGGACGSRTGNRTAARNKPGHGGQRAVGAHSDVLCTEAKFLPAHTERRVSLSPFA